MVRSFMARRKHLASAGLDRIFHDLKLSVFIFDYRGYGMSEGKPSEVVRNTTRSRPGSFSPRRVTLRPGR